VVAIGNKNINPVGKDNKNECPNYIIFYGITINRKG